MMDLNECFLVGRLTADPETSFTQNQHQLTKFSIANNEGGKDGKEGHVNFFNCVAWNKTAEIIAKYCKKGSKVLIKGRQRQERWADKESGKNRSGISVVVDKMTFMGGKGDNENNPPSNNNSSPYSNQDHNNPSDFGQQPDTSFEPSGFDEGF